MTFDREVPASQLIQRGFWMRCLTTLDSPHEPEGAPSDPRLKINLEIIFYLRCRPGLPTKAPEKSPNFSPDEKKEHRLFSAITREESKYDRYDELSK